ncbi:hypothetical protein CEXT_425171 [Caerostris extrusa]|uniref:Uncharacterized protein n=1 Tax=Caerostris extrusa TaxID=172846 RepID=A0AAV4QVI1_CAEEX|nr:hypothetical protein CEXT_425171 [Caerostris extrusa]
MSWFVVCLVCIWFEDKFGLFKVISGLRCQYGINVKVSSLVTYSIPTPPPPSWGGGEGVSNGKQPEERCLQEPQHQNRISIVFRLPLSLIKPINRFPILRFIPPPLSSASPVILVKNELSREGERGNFPSCSRYIQSNPPSTTNPFID